MKNKLFSFFELLSINVVLYSIGLFLGRISGFFREIFIANHFKISNESDIIILLLTIPDFINNLLSVTILSSVILPILAQFEHEVESVIYFTIKKLSIVLCFFLFISVCTIYFIFEFNVFILLFISLLSVIPNVIAAVFISYLNFKNNFFLPSLGTLIFNTVIISFLFISNNLFVFSVGIVLAAFIRFASVFARSFKLGISKFRFSSLNNVNYFSFNTLITAILGNGVFFLFPLIDKIFASRISYGSITILSYAEKIYLLPVSVYLTSIAVTSFPEFIKLYNQNDFKGFISKLKTALISSSFLGFITLILFILFNKQIVYLVFGFSDLSKSNLMNVAYVNIGYIPMLFFSGINSVILCSLYAINKVHTIFVMSLFLVFLKIVFNLFILFYDYEVVFIAYSTSFLAFLQFVFSGLIFILHFKKISL